MLLSATSNSAPGNGTSDRPSISADGRYVVFQSAASNLVADDTNARTDIFLLDRQSGSMTRVSRGVAGAQSNGDSVVATIAAAGRYIAFESTASNLVSGDTNLVKDVFVHDAATVTTTRVSVSGAGTAGNGESFKPRLSSDGRFVAFMSYSTLLVMNDTNSVSDVFLHDRDPDANGVYDEGNGTTVRASWSAAGAQLTTASDHPSISADGRYVAFTSGNGTFVYDRVMATTQNIAAVSNGASTYTSLSSDGRYVAFVSAATNLTTTDSNSAVLDVFVHDRTLATTILASVSQSGAQSNDDSLSPVISADGRYVAFVTEAGSLTTRSSRSGAAFDAVSGATGGGGGGGGTATTYYVYRRDLNQGTTVRASSASGGSVPNASSGSAAINSDGTLIAFASLATNLTCGTDNNAAIDVFIRDLRSSTATPSCGTQTTTASSGGGAVGWSLLAALFLGTVLRLHLRSSK